MSLVDRVRQSEWWRLAEAMPDRHYDEDAGVHLSDHLDAVYGNLEFLVASRTPHEYFDHLLSALKTAGLDPGAAHTILAPVALLHDIGKVREDKNAEGTHPLTGKRVRMRHPVVGVLAGMELLPPAAEHRNTILALIDEHDTPYSWYMQYRKTGHTPHTRSWARLDRRIDPQENGSGILLLCVFKIADIDGHEDVEDVIWFIGQAYESYLRQKGKWVPIPSMEAIRALERPRD